MVISSDRRFFLGEYKNLYHPQKQKKTQGNKEKTRKDSIKDLTTEILQVPTDSQKSLVSVNLTTRIYQLTIVYWEKGVKIGCTASHSFLRSWSPLQNRV